MPPVSEPPYAALFRLFHDGHKIESIRSGWRYTEEKIADLLLAGWRAGEKVEVDWLLPASLKDRVLETIRQNPEMGALEISGKFQGKISAALIRCLREVAGPATGLVSRLFTEETAPAAFDLDMLSARSEILFVTPHVKSKHWLRYRPYFERVQDNGGQVAIFSATISDLVKEDLKTARIILIEKRTNANLCIVDGRLLWEGSWCFLAPPVNEEHVRRSESRLQCDEIRDLHDLYL